MWSGRRIAVVAAGSMLIVAGIVGWRVREHCRGEGVHQVAWYLSSAPAESTLALSAFFGGCQRWEGWTVKETASTVLIDARAWSPRHGVACPSIASYARVTLGLQQPLGTRLLLGCDPGRDDADCTRVVTPEDEVSNLRSKGRVSAGGEHLLD